MNENHIVFGDSFCYQENRVSLEVTLNGSPQVGEKGANTCVLRIHTGGS